MDIERGEYFLCGLAALGRLYPGCVRVLSRVLRLGQVLEIGKIGGDSRGNAYEVY